jgi:hypothetical protein
MSVTSGEISKGDYKVDTVSPADKDDWDVLLIIEYKTKPQTKFGATLWAACLLDGGVVARSLQIHFGICSSLAPSLRRKSTAANVCVFMK